jgi:hypothetical protein
MHVRTDDLTVSVSNGQTVTLNAGDLELIARKRNQANLSRQQGNARDEMFTRRELRQDLAERLNIPQALAATVLAGIRTDDLYTADEAPAPSDVNTLARMRREDHLAATTGRPDHLDLAVRWDRGWKTYEVTGTRHAYYLLRKLAGRDGFQGARLNDVLVAPNGTRTDNVIALDPDDITGSDRHGKYRALLDRNNSHYDLGKDERQH